MSIYPVSPLPTIAEVPRPGRTSDQAALALACARTNLKELAKICRHLERNSYREADKRRAARMGHAVSNALATLCNGGRR